MKRTLIIAAAALMLGIAAQAQENEGQKRERPDEATLIQRRTEMMVKQLGLDENQAKQLLELNKEYSGKMGPMMGGPGVGRPPRPEGDSQDSVKGEKQQKDDKAAKGVGKNKKSSRKDSREQKDTTRRGGPGMGPGHEGGQRMDEEQMDQMKANREAYEAKLKAILSEDQYNAYKKMAQNGPTGRRPGGRPEGRRGQ